MTSHSDAGYGSAASGDGPWIGLVKTVALRMRLPWWYSFDEAISAGYLGAVRGQEEYVAGKGPGLSTFIWSHVRWAILSDIRREARERRWTPTMTADPDRQPSPSDGEVEVPELGVGADETARRRERMKTLLSESGLTAGERRVIVLLLDGKTVGEVARKLGRTPAAIWARRRKAFAKMREVLEKDPAKGPGGSFFAGAAGRFPLDPGTLQGVGVGRIYNPNEKNIINKGKVETKKKQKDRLPTRKDRLR